MNVNCGASHSDLSTLLGGSNSRPNVVSSTLRRGWPDQTRRIGSNGGNVKRSSPCPGTSSFDLKNYKSLKEILSRALTKWILLLCVPKTTIDCMNWTNKVCLCKQFSETKSIKMQCVKNYYYLHKVKKRPLPVTMSFLELTNPKLTAALATANLASSVGSSSFMTGT